MKKPKRLSLREMWRVYNLLKPALSSEITLENIISDVEADALVETFGILYDNFNSKKLDLEMMLDMFTEGLRRNNFLIFIEEIEKWQQIPKK